MVREVNRASTSPEKMVEAAESVARSGKRRVIRALGKSLAIVPCVTAEPAPSQTRTRRSARFSMKDPLWGIRGIIDGPGPTDVAANKDKYLAEAYAAKQR